MSWRRSTETKRRYKKLYNKTKNHYGSGVWFDDRKGRFIKFSMSRKGRGNHVAYVKRKCNRAIRRYKGDLSSPGSYRKISEYWWEIF